MPKITYATIYTQGLGDSDAGAAFAAELSRLRAASEPIACPHHVGGRVIEEGEPFERVDPCDPARVVSRSWTADRALVERAVETARAAQPAWRALAYTERVDVVRRTVDRIRERQLELAGLLGLECGKTPADAFAEVEECVAIVELYCRQVLEGDGFSVDHAAPSDDSRAVVTLRPYGVFGVIAPFNFPLAIPMGMVAAALITGNAVVFKPSAITPACGEAFVGLFDDIGLPEGALTCVQGGAETGQALAESAVDGLAFTGSADVGLDLAARLTQPPFSRPVLAEMGGKNPAIITGRAGDLETAARAVVRSAFGMSGQKCNACSRAVVTDDVYDEFVERLRAAAAEIRVGDPLEDGAFTGPLISETSRRRFVEAVDRARRDGRVVAGGGAPAEGGFYVEPTIVDGLPRDHDLVREELFLPILSVVRVPDLDAALDEANAVRYGLSAGIFSDDAEEQARFLDEIEAGIVFVNNPGGATTGVWPGSQTMSGWKASGSSGKGGFGPWYLQQFAREQSRTIFH